MRTFVHLGRFGDIINTLPLLKHAADAQGEPVQQVVSTRYASILEGVSYVQARLYQGEFADLLPALELARHLDPGTVNLQVSGKGWQQPRRTDSFLKEQWSNAGMASMWDADPVVFDRRDPAREEALLRSVREPGNPPLVLVATHGFSSPFAHGEDLLRALRHQLHGRAQVVDMAAVQAHRIYDLLGLYDQAACLVTIDTMHMHLARASHVPVVALSNDTNTPWHRSAPRAGQVLHAGYSTYGARKADILLAVERCLPKAAWPPQPRMATAQGPRFVHVFPMHAMGPDARRRHDTAARSWTRLAYGQWHRMAVSADDCGRSARSLGDERDLLHVHDVLGAGLAACSSDDDIVVLSNNDVCLRSDIGRNLERMVRQHGACFTHRWDFPHPVGHITAEAIAYGTWYPGSDLFAFSPAWWRMHGAEYPDMLLGAEYVDAVLRQLIKKHCGPDAEVHRAVFHEMHASGWKGDRHSAAALHNARLARGWFAQHGCDDLDPFGSSEAQRIRAHRGTPLFAIA